MFIRTNVRNYAGAYRVIQAMDLQAPLNTSEVREAARESLGKVLTTRMEDYIDQYLDEARDQELADRRNGYYGRHLLTELGDVFMSIPRTRLTSAARVLERYGRRSPDVDRAILNCFVLGCSTRKVAKVLAPMLDEHVSSTTVSRIAKTLDDLRRELSSVRTGRASLHLLDGVRVDYYGTSTPLNQVATLSVPEARLIMVKPWEKNLIPVIEKAIRDANLGVNPQSDKDLVRVPIPPLTEERRKEIVKQVKHKGEDHKVAIRNQRRDAKELIEVAENDGDISADDAKKALEKMQKETDEGVKKVDEIISAKEKEVMQV